MIADIHVFCLNAPVQHKGDIGVVFYAVEIYAKADLHNYPINSSIFHYS